MFGGLRIGLYDPVKKLIVGKDHVGDVGLGQKIVAGLFTGAQRGAGARRSVWRGVTADAAFARLLRFLGALAICIASPTDLVKVRMQTEGKLPPGCARPTSRALCAHSLLCADTRLRAARRASTPPPLRRMASLRGRRA